jgi:hypothetical protein
LVYLCSSNIFILNPNKIDVGHPIHNVFWPTESYDDLVVQRIVPNPCLSCLVKTLDRCDSGDPSVLLAVCPTSPRFQITGFTVSGSWIICRFDSYLLRVLSWNDSSKECES